MAARARAKEWDDKLVDSLRNSLGDAYQIRYPRMPGEDDPSYARWSAAILRELTALEGGALVVGHSVGGTILINALAMQPPARALQASVLIAAPFVGMGGWPSDEFESPCDLGSRLPHGVPVHVFQGLADRTTPRAHANLYIDAIPQATLHVMPGRNHQLNDDLSEVAAVIASASHPHPSASPGSGSQQRQGSVARRQGIQDTTYRASHTSRAPEAAETLDTSSTSSYSAFNIMNAGSGERNRHSDSYA